MYTDQSHYQTLSIASRVEAAGAHELVSILYEELIRALDVTRVALTQQKAEALRCARERASAILLGLQASLDLERGGEPAASLSQIYRTMQKELAASVAASDATRLVQLRTGILDLLHAWNRIGLPRAA